MVHQGQSLFSSVSFELGTQLAIVYSLASGRQYVYNNMQRGAFMADYPGLERSQQRSQYGRQTYQLDIQQPKARNQPKGQVKYNVLYGVTIRLMTGVISWLL